MKSSTFFRIFMDYVKRGSGKEKYWSFRRFGSRLARLSLPENRYFAELVAGDQIRYLLGSVPSVKGQTCERADAAALWLVRAQDATEDDGVSAGYFPCENDEEGVWRRSYPETTGYIIDTLLGYAKRRGRDDIRERCFRMARWEAKIQMPSGAVQGGSVRPPERQTPAVFNTGMVLHGYTTVLLAGVGDEILPAARRAADYLVWDQGDDGHFRTQGDFVAPARIKTYNCLCGWALVRFAELTGESGYRNAGVRSVEAAVREQRPNGWFANNCLDRPDAPLLHTIGYTLQGILEVGILAGRVDLLDVVKRGVGPIIDRMGHSGFLHGRYYADWEPAGFSACLTGSAQIAVVCYRLFEATAEARYARAADLIVDHLKGLQSLKSRNQALNGALAGSFPVFGEYKAGGFPSWATKYFLDALLLQERLSGNGTAQ
jgi:hypothetical protein